MEKFIEIVDHIHELVDEADTLVSEFVLTINNGSPYRQKNINNEPRLIQITEELIIIVLYSQNIHPILNNALKSINDYDLNKSRSGNSIQTFASNTPCPCNECATGKLNKLSEYMEEYILMLDSIKNPDKIADCNFKCTETHSIALIMSYNYHFNKSKQEQYQLQINNLTQELSESKNKYNQLEQEVVSLRNRIASVIPEPVVYDYEEIKSRIDPFRSELIIVQRTFARIINSRMSIPIAHIVSK